MDLIADRFIELLAENNRQQAEIERLEKDLEDKQFRCDSCDRIALTSSEHRFCVKQAKAEAIKEFAERLCKDRVSNDPVVIAVKVELEMVGEG